MASILRIAVILSVLGSICPAGESLQPEPSEFGLGLNLAGVTDWSSEIVFVDVFKAARPWISQAQGEPWGKGGPLDVDELGHVRSLRPGQFAETVLFTDFGDRFPSGVYTCLYEGEGDLDFTGDAKIVERSPGRLRVEIRPNQGSAFARITWTNPSDPLRRIRLIMPGHEETCVDQPFAPAFLDRWSDLRLFRFMDWARTNNSPIVEWSDRPTPEDHSQALRGVAVEHMIALCNTQRADAWFCMPHRASDDYVCRFARLVKERLRPELRVYVEYSNECWNGQFEQARFCAEQGRQLKLSDNAYEAQLRFYSQRAVEIFQIWEEVFDDDDRLVRVLASQSANAWTAATIMDWNDASRHADALAIAPYFGNSRGSVAAVEATVKMTPEELIEALSEDVAQSRAAIEANAAEARKRGLSLIAYEGGQHLAGHGGAENNETLTELFHATNRHPGMKALYRQHLDDWRSAGGGVYALFSSMGNFSKWGSWGLLEYADQPAEQTPKWNAVREVLDATPPP